MDRINPNWVTAFRALVCTPAALVLLQFPGYRPCLIACIFIMAVAEFTDWLDGHVAKNYGKVSDWGKIFDPFCDALWHLTVWVSLAAIGWVPVYLVWIFMARDLWVSMMRTWIAKKSIVFAARQTGKYKAATQAGAQISIVALHIMLAPEKAWWLAFWLATAAVLVTIASAYDYTKTVLFEA